MARRQRNESRGSEAILGIGAVTCVVLLLAITGCRTKDSTIVGHYPGGLSLQDWRTIARTNQPQRGEILRIVEAGRSESLSNHIVVVRSRELPHRHNHHDSTVMILEGRGRVVIGKEERRVQSGSILFIPRGTVHHFTNESDEPSVALVVFAPPFDSRDREVVRPVRKKSAPGEPASRELGKSPGPEPPGRPAPSPGAVLEDTPDF